MFRIFQKDPPKTRSISTCVELANGARIIAALENGNYSAFLIFLDEDAPKLKPLFENQEALSAFVGVIENRLSNRQFDDPGAEDDIVSEAREMTRWKPNMNVLRGVMARGNKPFFKWEP